MLATWGSPGGMFRGFQDPVSPRSAFLSPLTVLCPPGVRLPRRPLFPWIVLLPGSTEVPAWRTLVSGIFAYRQKNLPVEALVHVRCFPVVLMFDRNLGISRRRNGRGPVCFAANGLFLEMVSSGRNGMYASIGEMYVAVSCPGICCGVRRDRGCLTGCVCARVVGVGYL